MKNKILLISPYFPYPHHDGGRARMYNLIKHLAPYYNIYLLSFISSEEEKQYIPHMEQYCKKVFVVLQRETGCIKNSKLPRTITCSYTKEMVQMLRKVINEVNPDLVQIDFFNMSIYVKHISNIPVIYTNHDISSLSFKQSFYDRDLPEKQRFIEWSKIVYYEKQILKYFHSIIVLTQRDQKLLKAFSPKSSSVVIPTGVDIDYYFPVHKKADKENNKLLFVGHYKHYPNYEAVMYFVEKILPLICKSIKKVKFTIAGSGMHGEVLRLRHDNINFVCDADDLREYYSQATVFVAPVRLGGGIKGKVLEAMACGVPVVATKEVQEGIKCVSGKHLVIAKNEADFAKQTIKLLRNKSYRNRIALHGRKFVEQYYDWNNIASKLDSFYHKILYK